MIPQANPRAQYLSHQDEIDRAIARVLDQGRYVLGQETAAFEGEFAGYLGVRHAAGAGSGTEALHLALRACNVGPGDEVITVPHTAVATVAAIELCGATPILVDIDPISFTLDPSRLEPALSPRTKAIIPVHLYGQSADLEPILALSHARGIWVIEDCAQSHGATYHGQRTGAWGDIACFSFYPTKNLGAIGDGGLVATDNPDLAENARLLREYGWRSRYVSDVAGWNTRLDELQAAILRVKLRTLDADNARRRRLAALYDAMLASAPVTRPVAMPYGEPVYHLYVIRSSHRDDLQAHLRQRGIGSLVHYPVPIHLQPAYRGRLGNTGSFPHAERAAAEVLSLPLYPELAEAEIEQVADAVIEFNPVRSHG